MSVPVPPKYKEVAATDNLVREDTSLEALTALKPVFDRRYGTVTAGNASPLTDGAAALILMSEEKAKALGYQPLGFLKSYAFAATDPGDQLLQGPAYAAPIALDRAGMKLSDIELIDMHEAFAAQIASNIQAFDSKAFAQKLGRKAALGEVNRDRLNVNGGLDRPRSPVRRHRRADPPPVAARAEAAQPRARPSSPSVPRVVRAPPSFWSAA